MGERSYCRTHSFTGPLQGGECWASRIGLPPPPEQTPAASVSTWWRMASHHIHGVLWHRVNCACHVVDIGLQQRFLESKWKYVVLWSNYVCTHNPTHSFYLSWFSELSTIIPLNRIKCKEGAMCFLRGRKWIFKYWLLFCLQRVKALLFRDQESKWICSEYKAIMLPPELLCSVIVTYFGLLISAPCTLWMEAHSLFWSGTRDTFYCVVKNLLCGL